MASMSTDELTAAAVRAHRQADGPSTQEALRRLAESPPAEANKAWLRLATRAHDALPPGMSDDLLGSSQLASGDLATDGALINEARDHATTFISLATQGMWSTETLNVLQQRNPYLPAALMSAFIEFLAELPQQAVADALERLADGEDAG
jgi:hypothetical protein